MVDKDGKSELPAIASGLAQNRTTAMERETEMMQLRLQGMKWAQIAETMGISVTRAMRIVQRAMAREHTVAREQLRYVELERLDELMSPHWQMAMGEIEGATYDDQYKAGLLVLKIMERRSKYVGLDAPDRIEITYEAVVAHVARLRAEVARERTLAMGDGAGGDGDGTIDAESVSVESNSVGEK
jgi:hypothetical protein